MLALAVGMPLVGSGGTWPCQRGHGTRTAPLRENSRVTDHSSFWHLSGADGAQADQAHIVALRASADKALDVGQQPSAAGFGPGPGACEHALQPLDRIQVVGLIHG